MSEVSTYNGYSNRETWLVSLWLNNDQASYQVLEDVLRLGESGFRKAEKLEELVSDQMYGLELNASLFNDLLSTALSKVDWLEVIKSNQD